MHIIFMWISRQAENVVRRMAESFPAVLVTGARQVGKTSLLRRLFPEAGYITLDYPAYAEAAVTEPEGLLAQFDGQLIVDEIQYAPALLRYLKVKIDEDRVPGRFLLTGSQTFSLMQGVSESLAGRCGIAQLYTLSRTELLAAGKDEGELDFLFRGGYPELYVGADEEMWFPSYVATYLERDIRNVLRVLDLREYHRFLKVAALRNARVVNYTELARDVGIAPNTARKWLGLLETSGLVDLLEPYFGNHTKRVIKSPKLVFLDTGLTSFLCGFSSAQALGRSPFIGSLWESDVYGELVRWLAGRGGRRQVLWWRTVSGHEVDFVVELAGGRIAAIECKWAQDPGRTIPPGLRALRTAEGEKVAAAFVVCRTPAAYRLEDGTFVTNVRGLLEQLDRMDG